MDLDDSFADELDALRDVEDEQVCSGPSAKMRLQFPPSSVSADVSAIEESLLPMLNTSASSVDDVSADCMTPPNGSSTGKKRKPGCRFAAEEAEYLAGSETQWKKTRHLSTGKSSKDEMLARLTDGIAPLMPTSLPQLRKRIPRGAYVSVTSESGKRAYVSLRDPENEPAMSLCPNKGRQAHGRSLLGVPFDVLFEIASAERQKRYERASISILGDAHHVSDQGARSQQEACNDSSNQPGLWVDQYCPRGYIDLLSDESVNRALLKWLKLWDYVVFDKPRPKLQPKAVSGNSERRLAADRGGTASNPAMARGSGEAAAKAGASAAAHSGAAKRAYASWKKGNGKGFIDKAAADVEGTVPLDQNYRPIHKVALLCGRPGLGKTTLAHIVAQHAGYRVIEMNASDDRSADVFKDRIESATKMQSLLDEHPKPNCLIIDEIDGAPQAAINVLLTYINAKGSDAGSPDDQKKKKKKQVSALNRPIICICNDLYAPSLRLLRACANVIHFPPSCPVRLSTRLMEICKLEQLTTDGACLLALCEKAGNDIRSCINTLQFVRSVRNELTLSSVLGMSIGQKDEEKSLFSLWQDIFQLPSTLRRNNWTGANAYSELREHYLSDSDADGVKEKLRSIHRAAQACSDSEKLVNGLFDNYLHMKFKDPHLQGVGAGCEWLCFHDEMMEEIMHRQYYQLYGYLAYIPVMFHLIFASPGVPKVTYPHRQAEFRQKQQELHHLVECLLSGAAPSISRFVTEDTMVMDVLPSLMGIIQPSLRPVNVQLYSAREREQLSDLVNVMITYNLNYHQQREATDGQYFYVLEPNIEEVVRFSLSETKAQSVSLSYAAKQLIAREVELEKMRRSEQQILETPHNEKNLQTKSMDTSTEISDSSAAKSASLATVSSPSSPVPNHLQKLQPIAIKPRHQEETCRDFFGRIVPKKVIPHNVAMQAEGSNGQSLLQGDIWFKFKEGFSNAVRKNIRIKDFL